MSQLVTDDEMERNATEHMTLVGPKTMLYEAVCGLIEASYDGLLVQLGHGCSCDPALTHAYAALCFRKAVDALVEKAKEE